MVNKLLFYNMIRLFRADSRPVFSRFKLILRTQEAFFFDELFRLDSSSVFVRLKKRMNDCIYCFLSNTYVFLFTFLLIASTKVLTHNFFLLGSCMDEIYDKLAERLVPTAAAMFSPNLK